MCSLFFFKGLLAFICLFPVLDMPHYSFCCFFPSDVPSKCFNKIVFRIYLSKIPNLGYPWDKRRSNDRPGNLVLASLAEVWKSKLGSICKFVWCHPNFPSIQLYQDGILSQCMFRGRLPARYFLREAGSSRLGSHVMNNGCIMGARPLPLIVSRIPAILSSSSGQISGHRVNPKYIFCYYDHRMFVPECVSQHRYLDLLYFRYDQSNCTVHRPLVFPLTYSPPQYLK